MNLLIFITLKGITLFYDGAFKKAEKELKSFVKVSKNKEKKAQAYLYLGHLSNAQDATLYYTKSIRLGKSPYADSAMLELAKMNYAFGFYYKALTILKEERSIYPTSSLKEEVLFWIYHIYIITGEDKAAQIVHDKLKLLNPTSKYISYLSKLEIKKTPLNNALYTIQLGSFRNKNNALKLANSVKKKGFDANVKEVNIQGVIFYRVWSGAFSTLKDAKLALENMHKKGIAGGRVVKR